MAERCRGAWGLDAGTSNRNGILIEFRSNVCGGSLVTATHVCEGDVWPGVKQNKHYSVVSLESHQR